MVQMVCVLELSGLARIERLASFHEMRVSAKCGQPAPKIAGWVILLHSDRTVIQRDLQQIRQLENDGLYRIEQ